MAVCGGRLGSALMLPGDGGCHVEPVPQSLSSIWRLSGLSDSGRGFSQSERGAVHVEPRGVSTLLTVFGIVAASCQRHLCASIFPYGTGTALGFRHPRIEYAPAGPLPNDSRLYDIYEY